MEYTTDQENFFINFLSKAEIREDWITVMKFAMPTLIDNQQFLIEIMTQRAVREEKEAKRKIYASDIIRELMDGLNLKFVVASPQST